MVVDCFPGRGWVGGKGVWGNASALCCYYRNLEFTTSTKAHLNQRADRCDDVGALAIPD